MNVREALALGRERLASAAGGEETPGGPAETPGLDADVLLRYILGVNRAWLFTHPERNLDDREEQRYIAALQRRQCGEPVAYITGQQEFMGLPFRVKRHVLIPRPETETLVERALEILALRAPENAGSTPPTLGPLVVDVGTGSGAIAVSLAALGPRLRLVATDISFTALAVA
ncbi:MAG TPA: HemK/PrmC family methyltransferase, partial [Chloroflexota bacterium]|nr:HemK/PrmC family methyltransferase [Chloroflexota bacterium]